ncbi:MAG: hypothetical protein DI539_07190 [Flavobacterium psychrophilum]|nr:MAG: hypothetical protein DI539_07190 [Flavobacterium psychrophilum]
MELADPLDMKKIFFFLLLVISTTIHGQSIKIGQEARYVKTVVEWSTSTQNKSNPLKKVSEPYWTWDSKYINGQLIEVSQCYQNQYLIDFRMKADYCERYIIKNGILHHTIKEFETINLDTIKRKYREIYAPHQIDDMYFDDSFAYYYKFHLNNNSIACVDYYKTDINEWDKKTQQKFFAEKKLIEKKRSQELIKNVMSSDQNYEQDIRKMEAEIKQNKTEKGAGAGTGAVKSKDTILAKIDRSRKIVVRPKPKYKCNEYGIVVVSVIVDSSGKVIEATAGSKGTTNFEECLMEEAKLAALRTSWEPLYNSNEQQVGTIAYTFTTTD